jgi:DNA-binding beta-propeller fold protein YncE
MRLCSRACSLGAAGLAVLGMTACQASTAPASAGPHVAATVTVGGRAGTPVIGAGYVWVPNTADGTISKISARTNRVVSTVRIGDPQTLLAQDCGAPNVHAFPVGNFDVRRCDLPSSLAFWQGSLWALKNDAPALLRLDPASDRVLGSIALTGEPFEISAGPSGVWVTDFQHFTITQVDIASQRVVRRFASPGFGPAGVLVTENAIWVTMSLENTVARLDPATGALVTKITLGNRPLAMAVAAGDLWVRNEKSSSISRVDPQSNRVRTTVPITFFLGRDGQDGLGVAGNRVWAGGVRLDGVDPVKNKVVLSVPHVSVTLAGSGDSVWTADVAGTVSRVDL